MRFNTSLLHGNFSSDEKTGSTTTPIYQSSSFLHKTAEELENIFSGTQPEAVFLAVRIHCLILYLTMESKPDMPKTAKPKALKSA